MKRAVSVLAVLTMMAVPMAWPGQPAAGAGDPVTIHAVERGSNNPVLYACYTLTDLNNGTPNGSPGGGCDGKVGDDDGVVNGTVVVSPGGECDPCRVTQSLPPQPAGTPHNGPKPVGGSSYLLELPAYKDGPSGGTFTFRNFFKPYIVVTMINVKTGKPFKGACIGVSRPGVSGTGMGICDGNSNGGDADQDGRTNGRITTKRLPTPEGNAVPLTWKVAGSTPGYKARAVTVEAEPAKTGEFEKVTLKLRPIS